MKTSFFGTIFWFLALATSIGAWEKTFGGDSIDYAYSIANTHDNGFIIAGLTMSFGAGNADAWIIKVDPSGNIIWSRTYGDSDEQYAKRIQATPDGGYIITIETSCALAWDGHLRPCFWKVDSIGDVEWSQSTGTRRYDGQGGMALAQDGGYIFSGTRGIDGFYQIRSWSVKLGLLGDSIWAHTYTTSNDSSEKSMLDQIIPGPDGGYFCVGLRDSVSEFGGAVGYWGQYGWILRLDSVGDTIWSREYWETMGQEFVCGVADPSPNGGIVVAGQVHYPYARSLGWIKNIDQTGAELWSKQYAGPDYDWGRSDSIYCVILANTSHEIGYFAVGSVPSMMSGGRDAWLLRLNYLGDTLWTRTYHHGRYCTAKSVVPTSDGGYMITGQTRATDSGDDDVYLLKVDSMGYSSPEEIASTTPPNWRISVTPSPFRDHCRIETHSGSRIDIVDLSGRPIHSDMSRGGIFLWKPEVDLPAGTYLIRSTNSQGPAWQRVVYLK